MCIYYLKLLFGALKPYPLFHCRCIAGALIVACTARPPYEWLANYISVWPRADRFLNSATRPDNFSEFSYAKALWSVWIFFDAFVFI